MLRRGPGPVALRSAAVFLIIAGSFWAALTLQNYVNESRPLTAPVASISTVPLPASVPAHLRQRVTDLTQIRNALEAYRAVNGSYPRTNPTDKFSGLFNTWGPSTANWIPALVPHFLPKLPRDPRMSDAGNQQYLYRSDGKDFKLLTMFPEDDCPIITGFRPDLLDPVRGGKGPYPCHAYGYWSAGASQW